MIDNNGNDNNNTGLEEALTLVDKNSSKIICVISYLGILVSSRVIKSDEEVPVPLSFMEFTLVYNCWLTLFVYLSNKLHR